MELWDLLALARRRIGTVLLLPVLGVLVAAGLLYLTPTTYTASSSAYVSVAVNNEDTMTTRYSDAADLAEKKATAVVPVFTSTRLAQAVIDDLGLDETPEQLASNITATNVTGTVTINVTVTASSREDALQIADAVITHSAEEIRGLEGEASPVTVVPLASAELSGVSVSPSPGRYIGLGAVGGLLVGLLLVFGASVMDNRLQSVGEASRAAGSPALGALPVKLTRDTDRLLARIRELVLYTGSGRLPARTVLVASAAGDCGAWKVALELARATALAGQPTVLVDARMRSTETGRPLTEPGLSEVLQGKSRLSDAVAGSEVPGLLVMKAGAAASDPTALLASPRMEEALSVLSRDRCVIVAGPALYPGAEGLLVSRLVDRIVVVARFKQTTTDQLEHATEALRRESHEMSGVVLNDVPSSFLSRVRYGEFNEAA